MYMYLIEKHSIYPYKHYKIINHSFLKSVSNQFEKITNLIPFVHRRYDAGAKSRYIYPTLSKRMAYVAYRIVY